MKKSIYILEPLIIYIGLHDLCQLILYMGVVNHILEQGTGIAGILRSNAPGVAAGVQTLSMLLGMLGLMVFERYTIKRRNPAEDLKRYCINTLIVTAQVLTLAFSLNVIILNSGFDKLTDRFARMTENQSEIPVVMGVILFGFVSPVVEEYLFRGLLYARLRENFNVPMAICISAVFFGIYHRNLVQGVYGFLMGVFLAYIYEKFDSLDKLPLPLFTVVLCHALGNLFIYFSGRYGLIGRVPVFAGIALLFGTLASLYLCSRRA